MSTPRHPSDHRLHAEHPIRGDDGPRLLVLRVWREGPDGTWHATVLRDGDAPRRHFDHVDDLMTHLLLTLTRLD